MRRKEPLRDIIQNSRHLWDRSETRAAIRNNFRKVIDCRTEALGAEVYASDTEQKVVYHTCKSRACPSCGHRATRLWLREVRAALPDVSYAGIVFTLPDALWPMFQANRRLLHDLPALAAAVIRRWCEQVHGVQAMVLVVPHTFGRHLNFNPHLHVLASAGGIRKNDGQWLSGWSYDQRALMRRWRYAVIAYLRAALTIGLLGEACDRAEVAARLKTQYERWWNVHVQSVRSLHHSLRYIARYMRRPPLAQHRIEAHSKEEIRFRTKDHRLNSEVVDRLSPELFIERLGFHVHDHYWHGIRYFGLLAPRSRGEALTWIHTQLGTTKRHRPRHLSWVRAIEEEFGLNPLLDTMNKPMRLIARRRPRFPQDLAAGGTSALAETNL